MGGRVIISSTHMYACTSSVCIHTKECAHARARARASLSEIKGGKDAEGGRDLGLERRREGGREGESER